MKPLMTGSGTRQKSMVRPDSVDRKGTLHVRIIAVPSAFATQMTTFSQTSAIWGK